MVKPSAGIGLGVIAVGLAVAGSSSVQAAVPSNLDEWSLIQLTPTLVTSAKGGTGVSVALLDGKTDCADKDLSGRCTAISIQGGRYRYTDQHGTHTAGIVAGKTYGVAPSAKIVNYGVFDDRGYVATGSKLLNAWYDGQKKGATIASMSFGCTQLALCFTSAEVKAMADPGLKMLFVKAAGNDGANLLSESINVTSSQAAGAIAKLILVGSTSVNGTISSFSNRPGDACLLYSGAIGCTADLQWKNHFIVAPGEMIYSTLPNNKFGYMSGTSMATPVVAGVAALLEARWPTLKQNPATVAQILFTSATDLGAPGADPVYGWGLLNATKAFQANGTVALISPKGTSVPVTGTVVTATPTGGRLAKALGNVTVYDSFGRDFALGETDALTVRGSYDPTRSLGSRRLLGLGSQSEWASAFFAERNSPRGFAMFSSAADPGVNAFTPDRSLRMGIDLPFKGGMAQMRMTGATGTQLDFAYDPSLRPLSFFASTGLLKSSLFLHGLFDVAEHGRLSVYATSSQSGSLEAAAPDEPAFMRDRGPNEISRLALNGIRSELHQQGVGAGYWFQPDRNSIIGFNSSMLVQNGGYYDMASNLGAFGRPNRLINLGVAANRTFGTWELSAAGEVTNISTAASADPITLTPSRIVSGELRLRKAGVATMGDGLTDNLSLALVMPPRAVSGSLKVEYVARTADGLGRQAAFYDAALSSLGSEPLKVEAAYQLSRGVSWSFDLSGGLNLRRSDYSGVGEALASLHVRL